MKSVMLCLVASTLTFGGVKAFEGKFTYFDDARHYLLARFSQSIPPHSAPVSSQRYGSPPPRYRPALRSAPQQQGVLDFGSPNGY